MKEITRGMSWRNREEQILGAAVKDRRFECRAERRKCQSRAS